MIGALHGRVLGIPVGPAGERRIDAYPDVVAAADLTIPLRRDIARVRRRKRRRSTLEVDGKRGGRIDERYIAPPRVGESETAAQLEPIRQGRRQIEFGTVVLPCAEVGSHFVKA